MDVYLNGQRLQLDPKTSIGKGGEADVFDLGTGRALKVFKPPDHPDYHGLPAEQAAAKERLELHQDKLRVFPKTLPPRVVAPEELATDRSGKRIVGYSMPLVHGAEVLLRYGEPSFRAAGVPAAQVVASLCDLHQTVEGLHRENVVIGDFNDLNVLVKGSEAHLIDADSFQFGGFLCKVFTERFVDPLLCDPSLSRLLLARPFAEGSDWYAFAVMVMQSLLFVGPYGGVYKPEDKSRRVAHGARPLERLTVFHPEVQYPKPALPFGRLPDDLLQHFHRVFEKDERGVFPRRLLEDLRWTTCAACGKPHARAVCPSCAIAPAALKETTTVRGEVRAMRIFHTRGTILYAALSGKDLVLVFHEDGELRREDGRVLLRGDPDPLMRFRIQGDATLIGRGSQVAVFAGSAAPERLSVDRFGAQPVFDCNARSRFWVTSGRLVRDGRHGPEHVGEVLSDQTQIWVGPTFGFGFYRAGSVSVAFVFRTDRTGLNDSVKLPPLPGTLVATSCVLDDGRAWVFFSTEQGGRMVNRCAVVGALGVLEGVAEAERGDGTWLGSLRGKCAAGGFLLAATDAGLVRVEVRQGSLVQTRHFPDTEPFVDSECQLLAGPQGVYVVGEKEIVLLRMS